MYNLDNLITCDKNELLSLIKNRSIGKYKISAKLPDFEKLNLHLIDCGIFEEFWDEYLEISENIDPTIIAWMIQNDVCTTHLSHLDLDDEWLFKLSEENVEALQTLILRYYTDGDEIYHSNNASVSQFTECMEKIIHSKAILHLHDDDIRNWIINLKADNQEKYLIMQEILQDIL